MEGVSLLLDTWCLVAAFGVAFALRVFHERIPIVGHIPAIPWTAETGVRSDYAVILVITILTWTLTIRSSGVYRSGRSERTVAVSLTYFRALAIATLATGAATFVLKMGGISRVFFGYYFGSALVLLLAKQVGVIWFLRTLRRTGHNRRHALVIGAGRPAAWFASVLQGAHQTGYQLVGLLLTKKIMSAETSGVPVIGTVDDLDSALAQYPVDEVFVVGGAAEIAELSPVAQKLIEQGRVVSLVTAMSGGAHGVRGRATEFSGVPMVSFGPMPVDEFETGLRRITDVVVSALALIVLSPILAAAALALKVCDPGPVLFKQDRLGVGGKQFKLYKFRSMRADAEALLQENLSLYKRYIANDYKLPEDEDPRISRLGRFLRRSSIDELPQLWNILRGDMTLVGPRPIVPAEIEKYRPYEALFLAVRPGLTGHWQVNGRSDVRYPERAFMDLDYIGFNSIRDDLSILLRTVPAVLMRRGAH